MEVAISPNTPAEIAKSFKLPPDSAMSDARPLPGSSGDGDALAEGEMLALSEMLSETEGDIEGDTDG